MIWFHIEALLDSNLYQTFMVKAKTYDDAVVKAAKMVHATSYKLLGKWEPMEIDKNVMRRIA